MLHALDRTPGTWRLGALVAVSGFISALPHPPELDAFTTDCPDTSRTADRTTARTIVTSNNDEIVPPAYTHALGTALRAQVVTVSGGGHFLTDDGFTALPQVRDALRENPP